MEAIKSSVAALQQTGKFTQVQVSLEPQARGASRSIYPATRLRHRAGFLSRGHEKTFSYSRLLQAANIPATSPFVPDYVADEEHSLLRFFASEGFFAATAKPERR